MYKSYNIAKNANSYILDMQNINKTLQQLELERIQSALYLGYNGKVDFKNLKDSRTATDQLINKNQKTLNSLQYVRSRVDVISSDYKDILFDYYQDELMRDYIDNLKGKTDELSFGINSLKDNLETYYQSVLKRNNLNKERSFLTFILNSSKQMSDSDLLLWESILQEQESQNKNIKIIQGVVDGNYQLDINEWFQKSTQKENSLIEKQADILKDIKSKITYTKNYPDALKYLLMGLLFLLFIFWMLIKAFKKHTKVKTVIHNKHIMRKNLRTKEEIDMPLSNMTMQKAFNHDKHNNYPPARTFNPMEEFLRSTKHFINRSAKKKIEFNYFIDPTIPTLCIGEIEKIQKALDYLVNYVIATSKTKDTIKFNIENIASTKFESAIRFSIEDQHSQFTKEQKKQILSIMLASKQDKVANFDDIRDDLIYINELVHSIGGVFKIDNKPPKGAIFHITINFNRATS
jgi:hypothetical protein